MPSKHIVYSEAIMLGENLRFQYRNNGVRGIQSFIINFMNFEEVNIIGVASKPNAYQLWAAIVIYVGYKYASYDFNENDSALWNEIMAKTFEEKSFALRKYIAVDSLLNSSTRYIMSEGKWIKSEKTIKEKTRKTYVEDYADDAWYDMIGYIITSSFDSNFSFANITDN